MGTNTRTTRSAIALAIAAMFLLSPSAGADDTTLFSAVVPPNVLLMVDNSGSMSNLVWHPDYNPNVPNIGCTPYSESSTYSWNEGSYLTGDPCLTGKSRSIPAPDEKWDWYVPGHYLNWLFSLAANGVIDDIQLENNGTYSDCLDAEGNGGTYSVHIRSRIQAAQDVLREVICQVNAVGEVRFGLAQFENEGDPEGGYIVVPIDDYDEDHGDDIEDFIDDLRADTWTPLSELTYLSYLYFQSRTEPAFGKDGNEFDAYHITLDGDYWEPISDVPPTPVQYACQKNFMVLITDGSPTKDDFDYLNKSEFLSRIGDYNPDNLLPEAGNEEWGSTCGFCNETTWYLDDIAKFMQENDFQRDFDDDQVIDTYTVGFTTGDVANQLLQKTAAVGNGLFFQSSSPEELANAIVETLADIIEKSQSFTAATVPASRATDGNNFYASYFLPSGSSAYWEGHIKNFEFSKSGEIRDKDGNCAVDDPNAPTKCVSGPLKTNSEGFWDAADEIPGANARNLYVSDYGSGPPSSTPVLPPAFTRSNVSATDLVSGSEVLGISPNDTDDFPDNDANSANELRDYIVEYVQGCKWGSAPCEDRTKKLWDVFHSNPLVVGSPNAGHSEDSYVAFAQKYAKRDRILYAGSNGGFLHGFNAGEWNTTLDPDAFDRGTGEEVMGFMTYPARQTVKELARDKSTPKNYYMDGSPQVADVWFPPTPTSSPSHVDEWHTVLVGNMRQGGDVVYALDVTDPNGVNSALPYPGYLWEFPCEGTDIECTGLAAGEADDEDSYTYDEYMAQSWSDPIITRIRVKIGSDDNNEKGYDRWVAIFGAGYAPESDPNLPSEYDGSEDEDTTRLGRAVFIVDIETGKPIAMKAFDDTTAGDDRMKYAFAAAPAVFDLDFDGYADVAYFGDLGGNLWKWVIKDLATMPAGRSDLDQPDWDWVRLFEGDHCSFSIEGADCPEDHYKSLFFPPTGALIHGTLWLAYGTGERQALDFPGYPDTDRENNRFYVMKDIDPYEKYALATPTTAARYDDFPGTADFFEAPDADLCQYPADPEVGYYLEGEDGEKFVTNSVIFFGKVFTLSFIPDATADKCESGGFARLWGFDLFCGQGVFTGPTGLPEDKDRHIVVGAGVPNRPRVSVGPVESEPCEGDECDCVGAECEPECDNKVVVITSDGTAFSDSPTNECPSGIRLNSWRDF